MFEELRPHLIELRKRLFISVACVIVMFIVCFAFRSYILDVLKAPLIQALPEVAKHVNVIEVQEALFTAMKVSFLLLLSFLYLLFFGSFGNL